MKLHFYKYQGTGNDFIMLDNRKQLFRTADLPVPQLCDRRFGIGADGLIVLENHSELDFNMIYFNSDGSQSFCGNGSRCAVLFAKHLGIITTSASFLSFDGKHTAELLPNDEVKLKLRDVTDFKQHGDDYVVDTGSPHYVSYHDELNNLDLITLARKIRYSDEYARVGINVNFIHSEPSRLRIRSYERGVEDETLSCGTGVVASALVDHIRSRGDSGNFETVIVAKGGTLRVYFQFHNGNFRGIYLQGPAKLVYEGHVDS